MKYSLVNSQISAVVQYILSLDSEEYSGEKELNVEIDVNNKLNNVNIYATGDWMRNFCVQKFKNDVWRSPKSILIHLGDGENQLYQVCKIDSVNVSELEEPLLNYEDYLSLYFNIPRRYIRDKFNIIRDFMKSLSERHKNVSMKLIWKVNNLVNEIILFSNGNMERLKLV